MDPPIVKEVLKEMGTEGAIISVLMGAISILCGVIAIMYNRANKIYGYRLKERDILNEALTSATTATRQHTNAMESRSIALATLADAIKDQSASFEQLRDRVQMQFDFISREFDRVAEINKSLSAAAVDDRHRLEMIVMGLSEIREKITRAKTRPTDSTQ